MNQCIRNVVLMSSCFGQILYAQSSESWSLALDPYKKALKDLITVQQQMKPIKPIVLVQGDPIFATYQKLLAPYIISIQGYSSIVRSEFARNFSYHHDLKTLTEKYNLYAQQVGAIVALFPKSVQAEALEIFYQAITDSMVQTCYNIVEQSAYLQDFNDQTLSSVFQAYQLAWAAQTNDMKLLGAATVDEFKANMTDSMTTLFQAAVTQTQLALSAGMSTGSDLMQLYQKLELYYKVLHVVYKNNEEINHAIMQQNLLAKIKKQQLIHQHAQQVKIQADQQAQTARTLISLDVDHAVNVEQKVQVSYKNLFNVATSLSTSSYVMAADLYKKAQDSVSQQKCLAAKNLIMNVDLPLRTIQILWSLYLTDQSGTNNLESYPALQRFLQGQGSLADAISSIQNMIGLCSSAQSAYPNNLGALESTTQNLVIQTILNSAISAAEQAKLEQVMKHHETDSFVDLQLLQDTQAALGVLLKLATTMLDVVNTYQNGQVDQATIAQAMTYAQKIDLCFLKQKNLNQYLANLPQGLSTTTTWVDFVAQFFLKVGVISSVKQATGLAGSVKVVLPSETSVQDLASLKNQALMFWNQAQKSEAAGNFNAASIAYKKSMNMYQKLSGLESDAQQQVSMLNYAQYCQTRYVASSFAGIVQSLGAVSWGKISKIPTSYQAMQYQISFDVTMIGGYMPKVLQQVAQGQVVTVFSEMEQQDIFACIKAYLVAQLLQDNGLNFTDYFQDYQILNMSESSSTVRSYVDQISSYLNNFEKVELVSAVKNSSTSVTFLASNFPLSMIVPICSTLSSAATYYQSAAMLFAPATNSATLVTLGGQSYYPGDDLASTQVMLQNLGSVYVAQARGQIEQAEVLIQKVTKQLSGTVQHSFPQGFSQSVRAIKNRCLNAQALLYQPISGSAYSYVMQAGNSELAGLVMQEFFKIYQMQIDFMQQCLVADPTSNDYQTLISSMNQLYVNWASQLNSVKDRAQIMVINQKIADLYEFAGNQCLKYVYQDPAFPGVDQIHYMIAAQYFRSAQLQYQSLKNATKVQSLQVTLYKMYYQACQQNLMLFEHVRNNGIVYNSVIDAGESVKVSLQQMIEDMSQGNLVDAGEQQAYNTVQNLLLDSALVYDYLSKTLSESKSVKKFTQQILINFLQEHNVISDQVNAIKEISFFKPDIDLKLMNVIQDAYTEFAQKSKVFALWNNVLFLLVKNLYMQSFLGATSTETSSILAAQTEQFLTAIQKEGSSLQNPSAAYIQ